MHDITTRVELWDGKIAVIAELLVAPYTVWTEVVDLNEIREKARENLAQDYESSLAIPRE